jgi:hypothetical protein
LALIVDNFCDHPTLGKSATGITCRYLKKKKIYSGKMSKVASSDREATIFLAMYQNPDT